jgi:hypothetical protein
MNTIKDKALAAEYRAAQHTCALKNMEDAKNVVILTLST